MGLFLLQTAALAASDAAAQTEGTVRSPFVKTRSGDTADTRPSRIAGTLYGYTGDRFDPETADRLAIFRCSAGMNGKKAFPSANGLRYENTTLTLCKKQFDPTAYEA